MDVRDVLGVDVRDALGVDVSDGVTGWELEEGRRVLGELADEGEVRLSCMLDEASNMSLIKFSLRFGQC